ncbi:MFS transporter [Corynebacterium hadale]|uniref:Putative proline/betaine transporter n=1 Tax=Corynebacterium hadale TaxID=2026255 RepID=A0AB36RJJ9_9CORY|nr:MFS transporter [Corynebacterium hadale]PAT09789.1 MFS transporter [Corynebacterium hadale]
MTEQLTSAVAPSGGETVYAHKQNPRKAALASFLGSTLEYYDFVLFGTASAIIFNKLFFSGDNPALATIGSLMTFGVAYIARPLGGLVMSHVGDRIGRKTALMVTLVMMGCASISIGLLPTYESIGVWATVLLLVCRIVQGFSAGAESAGASTLTMEHSPEGQRGFFTSSVMLGCSAGNVLAAVVLVPFMMLPEDQMMSWGWRVPFLLSAVVLAVAYWVRTHLEETPVFEAEEEEEDPQVPALEVLKHQPMDVVRVFFITFYSVVQSAFMVYALSYATDHTNIERSTMLVVNALAMGISMITIPLAGILGDKIGRKPTLYIGAVGCMITTYFYFQAITDENIFMVFVLCIVNQGMFYSCWNGTWCVFFPEMFRREYRYTGMAMGNQLGLLLTGFTPAIAAALYNAYNWQAVVAYVVICMLIACGFIASAKETAFTKLEDLGLGR